MEVINSMSRFKALGSAAILIVIVAAVLYGPALFRNNHSHALYRCMQVADVSTGGIIRWQALPRPGFMCSYHNSSGQHQEYLGYMPR